MSTEDEATHKRRFHEHMSVLAANLDAAYMAAGRALRHNKLHDHETGEVLAALMNELSKMESTAKRMRDEVK